MDRKGDVAPLQANTISCIFAGFKREIHRIIIASKMVQLHEIFWSFLKIGTFTIGGGYAMIPLMEKELVKRRKWLSDEEFLDTLTISQALPGVFAVNMATSIGGRLRGTAGAASAIVGNILMPVLIILGFAMGFAFLRGNALLEAIFKGIRPAAVALIAAPVFTMAKTAKVSWRNCWIPIAAALLIFLLGISPAWIIMATIFGGLLYGIYNKRKERSL